MTCGGCAKGVAATVEHIDPGAELRFDVRQREVSVERATATTDALEAALAAAGWRSERRAA